MGRFLNSALTKLSYLLCDEPNAQRSFGFGIQKLIGTGFLNPEQRK